MSTTVAINLVVALVEAAIQIKRNDDDNTRKERLKKAKADPASYLKRFGRVQITTSDDEQ